MVGDHSSAEVGDILPPEGLEREPRMHSKAENAALQVEAVASELLARIRGCLAEAVVGAYLYGSATAGDFDAGVSDLDLLIATRDDVDDEQLAALERMHEDFEQRHREWAGRIDVSYLSVDALASFKQQTSPIVVISPGEPLGRKQTSPGWLMNWHSVRENGIRLLGPPPRTLIAETTQEDFVAAVRVHMARMAPQTAASTIPQAHAHAVLTGCRALHACKEGRQASKRQAAEWAARRHPEWADLIRAAEKLRMLRGSSSEQPKLRDDCVAFVEFVRHSIA